MSKLTIDQINKLTPPQLRKTVTDMGGDPMKINKANPADMRKWVIAKQNAVAGKPAAPAVRAAAAPAKPAVAAKPVVAPKAAPPRPVAPAVKPAAPKPAAPAAKPVPPKPQTPPPAAAKEAAEEKSWRETIELRLTTLEAQLGVAATTTAPAPVNNLASLDQFLQLNEETGEQDYTFDVSDVGTFNEEQLYAAGSLLGKTFKAGTPVRILRTEVETALAKLAQQTAGEAAPEVEEAAPEGAGVEYEEGQIVQAMYGEELFDPCRIEKVFRKKDGGVAAYDVYFQADNTVAKLDPAAVVGLSELGIE